VVVVVAEVAVVVEVAAEVRKPQEMLVVEVVVVVVSEVVSEVVQVEVAMAWVDLNPHMAVLLLMEEAATEAAAMATQVVGPKDPALGGDLSSIAVAKVWASHHTVVSKALLTFLCSHLRCWFMTTNTGRSRHV